VLKKVFELGNGDIARGTVLAFEAASWTCLLPPHPATRAKFCRFATMPAPFACLKPARFRCRRTSALHHDYVAERAHFEGRKPSFQMVVDDINAVSHSKLIGRP
jgi:methylaspartate mutase epsilon subunit